MLVDVVDVAGFVVLVDVLDDVDVDELVLVVVGFVVLVDVELVLEVDVEVVVVVVT